MGKTEISQKLNVTNPFTKKYDDFTKIIKKQAHDVGKFQLPNERGNFAGNVPSYNDNWMEYRTEETEEAKQLYSFPTQFNDFGQRTKSGVSLVDWDDKRINLKLFCEVKGLNIVEGTCQSVSVRNTDENEKCTFHVKAGGKVILCGGSASPRLLMKSKELKNEYIGKFVKDHICMPLGVYVVSEKKSDNNGKLITPKDVYEAIFATTAVQTGKKGDEREVCTFDFFSGELERLAFMATSLYLAYIPWNWLKRILGEKPELFTALSNFLRGFLGFLIHLANIFYGLKDLITFQRWGSTKIKLTTSLVKFRPFADGYYEEDDDKIILGFFEDERDIAVAEEAIKANLCFLESLGNKPPKLLQAIFRFITKIPYERDQVKAYVENFSEKTLLSEQHLAGGCLFGKVIDLGQNDPSETGKVFDTTNVHVADLSTVPIPRVSTQMTAYLIGHFVGNQLFAPREE